jgi:hypothetical protein
MLVCGQNTDGDWMSKFATCHKNEIDANSAEFRSCDKFIKAW